MADLATARKEAEKVLEQHDIAVAGDEWSFAPISLAVADALRSLLAASPEPAAALPDEVREAAAMLTLTLKMREAKHACNDATCRNVETAGWNVLAALAAPGGRS